MFRRSFLLVAALLALGLAGESIAGSASKEPPIIKRKDPLTGQKYREQTFEGGQFLFTPNSLSIAQSYYMFGDQDQVPSENLEVLCWIDPAGSILDYSCFPADRGEIPPLLGAARRMGAFSASRRFPLLEEKNASLRRRIRFAFIADPLPLPKLDLASGPLVGQDMIQGFTPRLENAYPMRALREEAEAVEIFECQVQSDLSLICRVARFEPIENSGFFAGTEKYLFSQVRISPELKDGRPAKGVRFLFKLRWRIPHSDDETAAP